MKAWALVPFGLASLAVLVSLLLGHGHAVAGALLQRGFALVCHQQPERSFWWFGGSVAVCARCLGVYLGAALGLLLRSSRRSAWPAVVVAATLNMMDVATELARLHGNWLGVRFALGVLLGGATAVLAASSRNDGRDAVNLRTRSSRPQSSLQPCR